jgi:hypothetical protein
VKADAPLPGQLGQFGNGIHHAVGKGRGRPHDDDGAARDGFGGGADVGAVVPIDGDAHHLDAEILGGLVESGVGRYRHDHLRPADAALGAGPVAIGFHGQHDALGAPGGKGAADLLAGFIAAQHPGGHGHDFGLVFTDAGPHVGMQRVGLGMQGIDLVEEVDMGRVAVIDGAGNITVFPAIGFPGLQGRHALQNRFGREAFRRYTRVLGNSSR